MAKRSTRKIVKVDDVQRTLALQTSKTDHDVMVIQIPDMLMRANRRQYQQCRSYSFRIKGQNTGTTSARNYEIYTLSNAWWVKKSIEFAKAVYFNATKDERAMLGDRKGKWSDFVIDTFQGGETYVNYCDLYQYTPSFAGDTDFQDMTAGEVTSDETIHESTAGSSEVEGDSDLGDDIDFGFTIDAEVSSGSRRAYNIFDQYMLTRQHVTPADTRAGPYKDLLELDQVAMKNLKEQGDNAPFNLDAFPNPWVKQDIVICDLEDGSDNKWSRFIDAPLGVVVIKKTGNTGTAVDFVASEGVLLDCRQGRYKGVHAPAYKATKLIAESSTVSKFRQ